MPNETRLNELEARVRELEAKLDACDRERRQFMLAYRILYAERMDGAEPPQLTK